jgi:hypothetical protein
MKTTFLYLLFAIVSATVAYPQDVVVSLQAESTVAGFQAGVTTMYEIKSKWALGGFYQKSTATSTEHRETSTFYGGQFQAPIVKADRMALFAVLRGGVVNEKFVVLVPGLETRIDLGKRFAAAIGTSMRMNYPSICSRFIVKLF